MNLSANISDLELTWGFIAKRSILSAVLGVEMILGIAGNTLTLFTKIKVEVTSSSLSFKLYPCTFNLRMSIEFFSRFAYVSGACGVYE